MRPVHPAGGEVSVDVGAYPPLVGQPVRAATGCDGHVPTGVLLESGDAYVAYGLSGGP